MGDKEPPLFECLGDGGNRTELDLDEIIRTSVKHYSSPSAILDKLVADVPDDKLPEFVGLVQRLTSVTLEYLDGVDDEKCWIYPLQPDFTRAELMADGGFRVPVADRHSLQCFLQGDEVAEAVDTHYCLQYLQGEEDEPLDKEDFSMGNKEQAPLQSQIEVLPVTVRSLETTALLGIAGAYYWSENGTEEYVSPADTLENIAKDAPPGMLIPLILAIEEHFPLQVDDDGCYLPVVWMPHEREYLVENGVVWEVFSERLLRWQLACACRADQPASNRFHGFDGERFDEKYYETLAYLSRSKTDEFGEAVVATVMEEQNRRYRKKYAWLFRLGTKTGQ